MKRIALVLLVLASFGCKTPAEVRGERSEGCERWEEHHAPTDCEAYFQQKHAYEERQASADRTCLQRAQVGYEECSGQTPLGSNHPRYGADENDMSLCRNNFEVASKLCDAAVER